jgi:mevalonate kinase
MEMENEIKELIEQIENTVKMAVQKQDWDAIYTLRNVNQQLDEQLFDVITKIAIPLVVREQLEDEY